MKPKTLLFVTSGLGDNLLTLPLALELEEQTDLTMVTRAGAQTDFFSICLPKARVLSYDKNLRSLGRILWQGWRCDDWIYPIGVCSKLLRLLHVLAFWRRAVGFTSLISKGAWLVEFGIDECLLPDLANRAWKNNLRLLSLIGLSSSRSWTAYTALLESRLLRLPKRSGWLLIHPGSAHYAGNLERYKRWPLERFVSVAQRLLAEGKIKDVSWLIGPEDEELLPMLQAALAAHPQFPMRILLAREFKGNLFELGKSISQADYMLTNDTGLAHLATLYDIPMTSLISGLGQPSYTGQNGDESHLAIRMTDCYGCCVGISDERAKRFICTQAWACMDPITVDDILYRVSTHLQALRQPHSLQSSAS